ncbi:uncharacterized protein [Hetaerina americana]|uniref:uncharacterized protein n=1 Tax=Hetaerina americana TaxID=62018 RepID=UPI003A7F52FF
MEVVQGGGPLVCAPRGPPPSTHPPLRLSHHHAEGPAAAALHVQTEEGGGGGLDPSWWRISASGSWDGGERRMRYGKLIDDRPGAIPGAVQRRKLELLETHAPGASMRVVHSQSTSSWRQGGSSELSSTGLDSSGSSRSLLSSSSSTRVTSYRQWSTNFSQTSGNVASLKQETRPALTEFGNLELALNPLDVSFLRTRGNVGRSGSIGSRRPPTRPRRLSSGAPSPDSGDSSAEQHPEAKSPDADFCSASVEAEGDGRRERSSEAPIATSPVTDGIRDSVSRLMALGWHPPGSGVPPHPLLHSAFRTSTPLHRKRSVSSEDLRGQEDGSDGSSHGDDVEDAEGVVKWERGVSVRRSLPSSEWRSAVGSVADGGSRRPRDPPKSLSVPALGGPASAVNRKSSLVTAESLREMKGRLKHRGSLEAMSPPGGCRTMANGGVVGDGVAVEGPKVSLRAAREEVNDDRRKSWSVGCRNLERREVLNDAEDASTPSSRRRSYAFEFSEEGKEGASSSPLKKESDWTHLQNGVRGESGHRVMLKGISSSDSGEFVHSRVNEMLKKWSALTQGPGEDDSVRRAASSSPTMRSLEGGGSRNSTTMWLEHGDVMRLENGGEAEVDEFATPTATLSGARTTLRLTHAKGHSSFKEELVTSRSLDKVHQLLDELPPSTLGPLVEDYSCPRGLSPVDWCDGESNGVLSIKEVPIKGDQGTSTSSAGISVTFSSADGGDGYGNNNGTRHHSVTHLESKELEGLKSDGALRIRASKKVEFSKTEVHFAAESGRFHIVETAGKPPPSNNFRRRRRSPTGTLNVDSGAVGGRGPSALSNGMRFGDSPYEKRLLAGTEGAEMQPQREEGDEDADGTAEGSNPDGDQLTANGETPFEYGFTSSRVFEDLDAKEEKEVKNVLTKVQDLEIISTPLNFRHVGLEDALEKPRGILRSNSAASNPFPWKTPQKNDDDSDDGMKPKFGGVRLRPVISPELHTKINLSSLDTSDPSRVLPVEKAIPSPLSPGQMELQKLLKSLRPVSVAPYVDNVLNQNDELGTQVANGGGMEVRISSGNQVAQTNMVMIGSDASTDTVTPLSVAQRVREVEERRQRELKNKLANSQRMTNRAAGQFSTRVTLGPVSSSVVSMEPQILAKKSMPQTLSSSPPSPKVAAKISTHSKITRIQTSQGDASAFAGDSLQHNQSDSKASALAAESRSRSEHCQDAPGITRIALGQRIGRTKGDGRECREDIVAAKEGGGMGPEAGRCKIFSALSVGRGREEDAAAARVTKGNGMKFSALGTMETSPEGPRECKASSSPSKTPAAAAWGVGRDVREGRTREPDHAASRDSFKSQRRAKEAAPDEAQKKAHVISSPTPPEAKIFSGVFGGSPAYDKSGGKEGKVEEGMDSYSVKLKVIEKRMEEVGSQTKSSRSDQRRSSLDEKSRRVVGEAARGEARPPGTGGTQTPRSPRLSEATRVSHVRQSALATTRPASPRQSAAAGEHTAAGSPTAGRALRKRVRRRASGGVEEERRRSGRKGGEEVSEESAILAELTRAADEILHVVNGYSDDPTSDEDAGAAAAARSKRRAARAQHSRKTSSAARETPKGAHGVAGAGRSGGSR